MRNEALADLEHHWGEAYRIAFDEDDVWRAQARLAGASMLEADTPDGLRRLIWADYATRTGPRDR